MSGPSHHFMQNMNNPNQGGLRNSFGPNAMQNTLDPTGIPNQMGGQMSQMGNPMMSQLSNPMGGAMGPINTQMGGAMQSALGTGSMQASMPGQVPQLGNTMIGQMTNTIGGAMSPMTTSINEFNSGLSHQIHPGSQTPGMTPSLPQSNPLQQGKGTPMDYNSPVMSRMGQETVQEIISRTQEVFNTMKVIHPPAGTTQSTNISNEKKARAQELLRTIRVLFKRLRFIYEKCNENPIQGMEYTHLESLIPYKDELDPKHEEKKNSEAYRVACEEVKEVIEQVVLKNKQLKEVIDHLRRIVWEINTMLTMRKS